MKFKHNQEEYFIIRLLLIIVIFIILFLSSFFLASAESVFKDSKAGTSKYYDSKVNLISIKDGFSTPKADFYLEITKSNQCLINCYAEGKVILYSPSFLFDKISFFTDKNKLKSLDSFKLYYAYSFINDAEIPPQWNWIEYKGELLSAGTYGWRIEANKKPNESIDWIASYLGYNFTEWAWWNSSWMNKQNISIEEKTGTTLINHEVLINVTYSLGMNADFSDIRFTNASENQELSYYQIDRNNSNWSSFYVRIPALLTSANTTIYMYYNNSIALSNSNASAILKANLMGSYRFDENSGTTIGNDYNASQGVKMINMESGDWQTGKINSALNFNEGTNDEYASSIGHFFSHTNTNDSISICGWINPDATLTQMVLAEQHKNWVLYIDVTNHLRFSQTDGGGAYHNDWFSTRSDLIGTGTFKHICITSDGSGASSVNMYVNGSEYVVTDSNFEGGWTDAGNNFTISSFADGSNPFIGKIDELLIYNRSITDNQISEIYNSGSGKQVFIANEPNVYFGSGSGIDIIPPNLTLISPSGNLTSKTFTLNASCSDNINVISVMYNITRGASTEVNPTILSQFGTTGFYNTSITLSSDANYILWINCSDALNNVNQTNLAFNVNTAIIPPVSNGGGGGGSITEIIFGKNQTITGKVCLPYKKIFYDSWEAQKTQTNVFKKVEAIYDKFIDYIICNSASSIVPI